MNTIIQYIHRPNNTELGKANTHESYLFVTADVRDKIQDMIPIGQNIQFSDLLGPSIWTLKAASGKEFRINQLADLYANYDVEYGDEVILQKHCIADNVKWYASVKKVNAVGLIRFKQGEYEIANIDKFPEIREGINIKVLHKGDVKMLEIRFLQSKKKRSDSPSPTDMFQIYLDGNFLADSMLMRKDGETYLLEDYNKYEYHKITWEE